MLRSTCALPQREGVRSFGLLGLSLKSEGKGSVTIDDLSRGPQSYIHCCFDKVQGNQTKISTVPEIFTELDGIAPWMTIFLYKQAAFPRPGAVCFFAWGGGPSSPPCFENRRTQTTQALPAPGCIVLPQVGLPA